jgi:alanine-synthesizing transaminase
MQEEFYRIKRLPPYVFAEVNALKAKARAAGRDVIDLGMGNPDGATPEHIVKKLIEAVQNPKSHGYSVSRGINGLRRAYAAYYARRFGVTLDPEREVITTLGSKEGLANLAQAITAPGDIVLVPNPCYPIHAFGFIMAGASLRHVPIGPSVDFMGELKKAVMHSVPPPIAIVLNFPANPTAQVVGLDFYAEVVDFCRHHNIFVLSDVAYAEIYFDGNPPPSVLQVPGARDIAVEFSSLSKTYSMAGWRIGFAVGNARLIGALARVKSYSSKACARRDGKSRARPPACSPGRRFRRASRRWAASPSRSCCSSKPMSRSLPASASASMARAMSASRSWRTASGCAKPRATSSSS